MKEVESKPTADFLARLDEFIKSKGVRRFFAVMIPIHSINLIGDWHQGKWNWLAHNVVGLAVAILVVARSKKGKK